MDYKPQEADCSFCGKVFDTSKWLSVVSVGGDNKILDTETAFMHCCKDCHDKGLDKPI